MKHNRLHQGEHHAGIETQLVVTRRVARQHGNTEGCINGRTGSLATPKKSEQELFGSKAAGWKGSRVEGQQGGRAAE